MTIINFNDITNKRIHMVGIKGTGMTALTEILKSKGAIISGSDTEQVFYTDLVLRKIGITPLLFSKDNVTKDIDLVIYSAAYKLDTNSDLMQALEYAIPTMLYTEALGEVSKTMKSYGISGVHGKTTTTAITGTIIKSLGLKATVLAGSAVSNFDGKSTIIQGSDYFIAETCEYKRHFLSFSPKSIIVTSIESDHQDYYPEYKDIFKAFTEYVAKLPIGGSLIYCADEAGAVELSEYTKQVRKDIHLVPYGENATGSYKMTNFTSSNGLTIFSLDGFDKNFILQMPGKIVALDAIASLALVETLLKEDGLSFTPSQIKVIYEALASFSGSKRRSEIVGNVDNVLIMDDYAHHPTAIQKTLEGIKAFYSGRRIVVSFMSHTYSRTKALHSEFASSFSAADEVILHKIYASAREEKDDFYSGKTLFEETCKNHKNVKYFEEVIDALPYLTESLKSGDVFITMGAGDNWELGLKVLDALKNKVGKQ